jgi:pSer/pThr/pTyr-binding forkhead associated (FHA) protein
MEIGLIVLNGVHKGRHIPLTSSPFLIGRGKQCHLRPVREDVGREHCAIVRRGDALYLRDCGSTNGTILNRRAVIKGEVQVADGDVFDIGPLRFRLEVQGAPVPVIASAADNNSCFDVNEIFSGEPGEQEPKPDSTVQISSPLLPVTKLVKPLTDECEKVY